MTDKEKKELKDGVISIFKKFNILDHTATIGSLRDDVLKYIDSLQEEPTFKVGDRIRIKGTTVKGDVIKNIYQAEGGNTYFEFENSDDALANEMWELVEDHKEFKPIRKKQPEGVLKKLLDNMDEKELEETRKEMLEEDPVSKELIIELKSIVNIRELAHQGVPVVKIANHIANWQKNQIIKNAIKCEITWMDGFMLNYTQEQQDDLLEKIGAKVGDKVKLVIIKEE